MRWWLPVLIVLVFGGGLVAKIIVDKRESTVLCEAVNENRSTVRNLLVSARAQTPHPTKRERRFYSKQIAAVTPLDCGHFDRETLRRERSKAERKRRVRQAKARAVPSRGRKTPQNGSAPRETAQKQPNRAKSPSDIRPEQPNHRFPPPARTPQPSPGGPAPGQPQPAPPPDRTIFEQVCDMLPGLPPRVC